MGMEMNNDQLIVFAILGLTLGLFIWNRWRYDLVAVVALMAVALFGLIPAEQVFMGFGHPAVITVAAVLVISRGLSNAGVVDTVARILTLCGDRLWVQVATLTGAVAISSAFMNNVGALALLMPVAIWMSRKSGRSPSFLLMPLAFGSLLGGMLTMIGTPPNIIIAEYRSQTGADAFAMFDFFPVGLGVTLVGVIFISLIGWRLTPQRKSTSDESLFEIKAYTTEVRLPVETKFVGKTLHELLAAMEDEIDMTVLALIRNDNLRQMPSTYTVLRANDILLIEADSESLQTLLTLSEMKLAEALEKDSTDSAENEAVPANHSGDSTPVESTAANNKTDSAEPGELTLTEVIVAPGSILIGNSASRLDVRERYGVNILAAARQGQRMSKRMNSLRFVVGDILLVQGHEDSLQSGINQLGCLTLASRGLNIGRPRNVLLASGIFVMAMALIALGLVPAATGLVAAAATMVLVKLISPGEIYNSIDMPVIVLLAAMLPVGLALESTGSSVLIADALMQLTRELPPAMMLAGLMIAVMLLSNVINNAAAAILAAPIAIKLAQGMEWSADPFLMAVAVAASSAFLTPIGHQSNTLVMAPGGYKFSDYWRMGLPLSLLIVISAVPLILWIWPL